MMEPNEIVRAPMVHELKCWPEYYDAVERGDKPFEIRKWDRPYQVGDTLLLQEYDPEKQDYTGRQIKRKVTYLLDMTYLPGDNIPHFAGYVVLGLEDNRLCDCIERLQAENENLAINGGKYMDIAQKRYEMFEAAVKRADDAEYKLLASQRRERAMLADMKTYMERNIHRTSGVFACDLCRHGNKEDRDCKKKKCDGATNWEWRGPEQEGEESR